MKHSSSRSFYIGILKEEKKFVHGVGNTPEFLLKGMGVSVDDEKTEDPPKEEEEEDESVFGTVFRDFISKMESYRQFISLTLFFAPFLSIAIAERK